MEEGELTIADRGYNDPNFFIMPSETNSRYHKTLTARHETVNKRKKQFNILKHLFRNALEKHPIVYDAVVNVTQSNS